MRRTGALKAVVATLFLGSLAACGSGGSSPAASASAATSQSAATPAVSPSVAAGEPLDIGAILPLTGDGADYGQGMQVAIQIAVDEVNAAGGPMGRKFVLHVEDSGTNADNAVRAAHKLIDVDHVQAIIGTWASSETLAVAPITQAANIVEMNVSGSPKITTLEPAGKRTVFRVNASDDSLAKTVAAALYAQGLKTATLVYEDVAGPVDFNAVFKDAYTADGGTVLDSIGYAQKQASYQNIVAKATATKPQVYLVSCYTADGSVVMKQMYQADAMSSGAVFALPAWCLNGQMVQNVGPDVVNGALAFDVVPAKDSKAYTDLNTAYTAKTGKDIFTNAYAAQAYDSVNLLALAFQKAGKTTPALEVGVAMTDISNPPGQKVTSFAEGLAALSSGQDIDYDGASGPINFDANGDMAPNVGLFKVDNGKFVLSTTFSK